MKRKKRWQQWLLYFIVIFWCFIVLFPFYWLVTTSVKRPLDVSRGPKYVPYRDFQPVSDHWEFVFGKQRESTLRHFRNSLISASGSPGHFSQCHSKQSVEQQAPGVRRSTGNRSAGVGARALRFLVSMQYAC